MKKEQRENVSYTTVYVACDGTEFTNEAECQTYEKSAKGVIFGRMRNCVINEGLATMHRKGLEKRLTSWLDSIVADCEKIAKTCAEEELVKVAQFSNGEAIYERKTPRNELKAALLEVV